MEREDDEYVDPIKLVYEERRAANVDKDEEIAILRACGYSVPQDDIKMNEFAVKMLDFLDRLTDKESCKIKECAKTISQRRKMLRENGIKEQNYKEVELKTPLELLCLHSKHELDLFQNINECEEDAKATLLETIKMGFDIQNDSIDNIENIIFNGTNK